MLWSLDAVCPGRDRRALTEPAACWTFHLSPAQGCAMASLCGRTTLGGRDLWWPDRHGGLPRRSDALARPPIRPPPASPPSSWGAGTPSRRPASWCTSGRTRRTPRSLSWRRCSPRTGMSSPSRSRPAEQLHTARHWPWCIRACRAKRRGTPLSSLRTPQRGGKMAEHRASPTLTATSSFAPADSGSRVCTVPNTCSGSESGGRPVAD